MVLFDFERALRSAFARAFHVDEHGLVIKLCRFHFGQSVIRNFDKLGLRPLRKTYSEIEKWLKQILGQFVLVNRLF